jgi:hypothetical protein
MLCGDDDLFCRLLHCGNIRKRNGDQDRTFWIAGARAVFLNHAERPMTVAALAQAIKRANELGIETIVCAQAKHARSLCLDKSHPYAVR